MGTNEGSLSESVTPITLVDSPSAKRVLEVTPQMFDLSRKASGVAAALFEYVRRNEFYKAEGFARMEDYAKTLGIKTAADYSKTRRAGSAVLDLYPDDVAKALTLLLEGGYPGNALPELPNKSVLEALPRFLREVSIDKHPRVLLLAAKGELTREEMTSKTSVWTTGDGSSDDSRDATQPNEGDATVSDLEHKGEKAAEEDGARVNDPATAGPPTRGEASKSHTSLSLIAWTLTTRPAELESLRIAMTPRSDEQPIPAVGTEVSERDLVLLACGVLPGCPPLEMACAAIGVQKPVEGEPFGDEVRPALTALREKAKVAADALLQMTEATLGEAQTVRRLAKANYDRDIQLIERTAAVIARYDDLVSRDEFRTISKTETFRRCEEELMRKFGLQNASEEP